jgi:peptidoglycan/LPS O-acetylase OafA/YrhL
MSNPASASVPSETLRPLAATPGRGRLWRLEAVRGFAAFYVVLHHIFNTSLGLKHTILGLPFRFGIEAVLVFFILSGFVISYAHPNSSDRPDKFKNYLFKRLRRIYPIFVISLLLAYLVSCLSAGNWEPVNLPRLLGNIFMFQKLSVQPGVAPLPYAGNSPLWSLAYEWWFYMLFFPINRWVPRSAQKFLVLAVAITGMVINQFYPNCMGWYFAYFIIWWAGVELAHEFRQTGDISFSGQKTMLALVAVPILWYSFVTWRWLPHAKELQFSASPLFDLRCFLMTPAFILMVLAWRQFRFAGFDFALGNFRRLAGISFALYVFHYPIIVHLRLLQGPKLLYPDLILRIGLAFFLAWLAEGVLQKWINRITDPLLKRDRRSSTPAHAVPVSNQGSGVSPNPL